MTSEARRALLYCWLWNKPVSVAKAYNYTGLFIVLNKQLYPRTPFSFRNPLVMEAIEDELRQRPTVKDEYDKLTNLTRENLRKLFRYIKDFFEETE